MNTDKRLSNTLIAVLLTLLLATAVVSSLFPDVSLRNAVAAVLPYLPEVSLGTAVGILSALALGGVLSPLALFLRQQNQLDNPTKAPEAG